MAISRTKSIALAMGAVVWLTCLGRADLAQSASSRKLPSEQQDARKSPIDGYRLQQTDPLSEPLEAVKPRSKEGQQSVDALAHFMAGKLKESRNDFEGAYKEYEKAVEKDPNSVTIYQSLVPLAFSLRKTREAMKFALKAIELDPDNYKLMHRLGVQMAQQRKLPEALKMLERATQSRKLDKHSADYVLLMRTMAAFYAAADEVDKAADANEVILDALIDPDRYHLDFRTQAVLAGDKVTTFESLGEVFLKAKRLKLAIRAYEEAVKARKGKPGQLSYSLAKVYLQDKQFEQALEQIEDYYAAQLTSKGRDAYQLLAEILKELGREDELIGRLKELAEDDLRNAALQYYLAEQYLAHDRFEDAEKLYKQKLERSKDVGGYLGLASVYRRQRRAEDLLEVLGLSLEVTRDRSKVLETLAKLEIEVEELVKDDELVEKLLAAGHAQLESDPPELSYAEGLVLATLAAGVKKTDDAVLFYERALKERPQLAGAILDQLGSHLLVAERFDEAVSVFEKAVADPALEAERISFLYKLSMAYEMQGETPKALEAIREANEALPNNSRLHFQKAWIYSHSRQWEQAAKALEELIAKFPQLTKAMLRRCQFSLSNAYVQHGQLEKGQAILEEVLAEEPDDPSVNNDLGYLYADQGVHLEKAEGMIRKALAAEPDNPAYLDSMGWVLYKLGKHAEALVFLQKAVKEQESPDATILDHLGDCYDRTEMPEKAVETWKQALEKARKASHPDSKVIERIEAKLKNE